MAIDRTVRDLASSRDCTRPLRAAARAIPGRWVTVGGGEPRNVSVSTILGGATRRHLSEFRGLPAIDMNKIF